MNQKKLTPAEAFELMRQLNPSVAMIKPSVCDEGNAVVFFDGKCGGEHWSCPNIEWGGAISYRPERWRPATIEDFVRHVNGEIVKARIKSGGGQVGRIFGASKPQETIAIGIEFFSPHTSVWEKIDNVEVRE